MLIIFHCLGKPQFTEEYLGCFQVLAMISKATINILVKKKNHNILVHVFLWAEVFSTQLDKYHGERLLACMVDICLVL